MASNIFKEIEAGNISGVRRTISVFPTSTDSRRLKDNRTPLHLAAALGDVSIAQELLTKGATFDAADKDGNTPLHVAAEHGSVDVALALLTGPGRRLGLKAKNKEGQNPLHLASKLGHAEMITCLIEAGARTDVKDKAGCTPIDLAPTGDEAVVNALKGASSSGPSDDHAAAHVPASPAKAVQAGPRIPSAASQGSSTRAGLASSSSVKVRAAPSTPSVVTRVPSGRESGAASRAGPGSSAVGTKPQPAALGAVIADVQSMQTTIHEAAESTAAVVAAQKSTETMLQEALELVHAQARRMEDLESRLLLQEQRRTDTRHQMELMEARMKDWEESQKKEAEMQKAVSRLTTEQLAYQSSLQDLSMRVEAIALGPLSPRAPHPDFTSTSKLGCPIPSKEDDSASGLEALHQLVLGQIDLYHAHGAQLEDLKRQVQQVVEKQCSSSAGPGEGLGELKAELQKVAEELKAIAEKTSGAGATAGHSGQGVADRVSILELRLAQQSATVTSLSSQLGVISEKLIVSMSTSNAHEGSSSDAGAHTTANNASVAELGANVAELGANVADLETELSGLRKKVASLESSLSELQAAASAAAATATTTPRAGGPQPIPCTPDGTNLVLTPGVQAGNAVPELVTPGGRPDVDAQHMMDQIGELREALTGVRTELRTDSGALRREWNKALSDIQQRWLEQRTELSNREVKIKQLRELAIQEEEDRRIRVEFESHMQADITRLDTSIGLVQHKVEVLEEQMQGFLAQADNLNVIL